MMRRRPVGAKHLAASRGAIAVLAPVHGDALSLVIRSGWGAVPRVISSLGGRVVAIERRWQELLYARKAGDPDRETYLQVQEYVPLPFRDEAFDCVFVVDRSSALGSMDCHGPGSRAMMLREAFRVLKPGGSLVLESPNRFSFLNVIGKSDVGAAGGRGELVPRQIAGWSRLLRGRASQVTWDTLSHREYVRALRRAGFEGIERFVPWPDRNVWYWLWSELEASTARLAFGMRLRDRVAAAGFAVLRAFRAQAWLVPDYIHVARKPGGGAVVKPSVLDVVLRGDEPAAERRPVLRPRHYSGSLTFSCGARHYKLPLTGHGRQQLRREEEALRAVSEHPLGKFAVRPHGFGREGGVAWGVYPMANLPDPDECLRLADIVLATLIDSAAPVRLADTDLWRRLFGPTSEILLAFPEAARLMESLIPAADLWVPAGRVHGDLNLINILVGGAGEPVLIDWDRSERCSPIFLDVLAASSSHAFRQLSSGEMTTADVFVEVWPLQFDRQRLAFRSQLERCRGAVEHEAAVAVDILNRVDWGLRWEDQFRDKRGGMVRSWIHLAERALGLA
jgi:SAM-dependent methyltransferase